MTKIKCILFDIGGVLVNWHMSWITSEVSQRFDINEEDVVEAFGNYLHELDRGKINEQIFWKKIANYTNSESLGQTSESLWDTYFRKKAKINNDVVNLAKQIKDSYTLGIISNIEEITHGIVHDWNILNDFQYQFMSYKIGFSKPDYRIYEHVIDSLPFEPDELIFIDDRPSNVVSAQKYGINSIHFTNHEKLKESLENLDISL